VRKQRVGWDDRDVLGPQPEVEPGDVAIRGLD
jgi:hypothetical protein